MLSKYLINHDKKYIVKLQLGEKTDTADQEGNVIEEKVVDLDLLTKENITDILKSFIGKQEQIPPIYSAIKVKGKKLYEYARKGEKVEIKPRQIEIYDIKLMDFSTETKQINFEVFCGKGTYIRSLCEDIATKFGTVGYMKELKRTQVGNFTIEQSIKIDVIEQNINDINFINNKMISIEKFFDKNKSFNLNDKKLKLFLNGVQLTQEYQDGIYKIYNQNKQFIGIGTIKNKLLKRDIII